MSGARQRYEVKVVRDSIEIFDHVEGESVLFWDLPAVQARRLVRALREDLGQLDADAFLAAWRDAQ